MELSREMYKKIKSFNKQQMEEYLSDIYSQGHNNGVDAMKYKMITVVDKGIRNTPGIGEKRYVQIMTSISDEIEKEL